VLIIPPQREYKRKHGASREAEVSEKVTERGNAMDMETRPYALAREDGQAVWFLGTLVIVKATGEQTGGAFGLIDNLMPGGFASPYHTHRNEDESFYVVEGEMTFYVGEERVKAEPGAFVYGPRGVPHGFEVHGTEPARILLQNYPAGFEGFPVEVGEPAEELTIPPAEPPDMERLMAIAAKYDIEILGPLPGN
jgi:quercetin dioxygenase-like cupin family protein